MTEKQNGGKSKKNTEVRGGNEGRNEGEERISC